MPLGAEPSDYGAWYTLALALGAGWLAKVLLIDAVISPAGTGSCTSAPRRACPTRSARSARCRAALATTNKPRRAGVSILRRAVVGVLAFGPFKSWSALVERRHRRDGDHVRVRAGLARRAAPHRSGRARARTGCPPPRSAPGGVLLGEPHHLLGRLRDDLEARSRAMVVGLVLFAIGAARAGTTGDIELRSSVWMFRGSSATSRSACSAATAAATTSSPPAGTCSYCSRSRLRSLLRADRGAAARCGGHRNLEGFGAARLRSALARRLRSIWYEVPGA